MGPQAKVEVKKIASTPKKPVLERVEGIVLKKQKAKLETISWSR